MAHDARIGQCIPALLLLALIGGCNGDSDSSNQQSSPPPASLPPASPPPASTALQAVIYQTFAAAGDTDLHAIREDGTAPTPLATTAQREHFRGISSDGWVVYDRDVSDVETHLVSVRVSGGEMRELDASSNGKLFRGFTPDNRVIYEKSTATGSAIHSVRPDGTAPAVLVDEPYTIAQFIDAALDGRVLYQACERSQDPAAPPQCIDTGLYSVAADGSDRRLLALGRPRVALITADGRVLYEADAGGHTDLLSISANGGDVVTLANSPDDEWDPRLLPDGRILYARRVADQWDVYLVNADGTGNRALLTDPTDEFVTGVTAAGRILFVRGPSGQRNLYAIDPNGTGLAVLGDSTDDETMRRITDDGRVIYSARRSAGGFAQDDLYSVAADGTGLRALADTQEFEWFEDVAPDGRVVYMRCIAARGGPCEDPAAQSDLYSVRPDGTTPTALATTGAFETFRAVTTDNRVIFQRRVDNQHDIESVRTDGTEPRTLANTPVDERYQGLQ